MDESILEIIKPIKQTYNFQREKIVKLSPVVGTVLKLNQAGTITITSSVLSDTIYLPESYLYAECSLVVNEGALEAAAVIGNDVNITLENNFFPRCFDQMTLSIGSTQFESIDNPGEGDTLLKYVIMDKQYAETYGINEGWIPDQNSNAVPTDTAITEANILNVNNGYLKRRRYFNNQSNNKKFSIMFKLRPLFGLTDYRAVLKGVSLKLDLLRKINNEDIFYGAAETSARLRFEKLEWHLPILTPSLEKEVVLNKLLQKHDSFKVAYLKRKVLTTPINSASIDWDMGTISNNPRMIIVGFKDNRIHSSFQNNNHLYVSKRGNTFIREIRLDLNSTHFPNDEFLQIDPVQFLNSEIYDHYASAARLYGNTPQLDPVDFKNLAHIFVFDLTSQPEDIRKAGIKVILRVRMSASMNLTAYALILEDGISEINILRNSVTEII